MDCSCSAFYLTLMSSKKGTNTDNRPRLVPIYCVLTCNRVSHCCPAKTQSYSITLTHYIIGTLIPWGNRPILKSKAWITAIYSLMCVANNLSGFHLIFINVTEIAPNTPTLSTTVILIKTEVYFHVLPINASLNSKYTQHLLLYFLNHFLGPCNPLGLRPATYPTIHIILVFLLLFFLHKCDCSATYL